jgi:CBS domain-containing protein
MLVKEVMTRWPVVVEPGTTAREALRLLDEHTIAAMPVVDAQERVVGVVSDADLVRDAVAGGPRAPAASPPTVPRQRSRTVGELMSRPVTVDGDADVSEAVALMTSRALKSLPVVDDERRPVGVLSRGDVVHLVARSDERTERDLAALFALLRVDWKAVVHGGAARVEGPVGERDRSLARRAVATVPGVVSLDIVDPG